MNMLQKIIFFFFSRSSFLGLFFTIPVPVFNCFTTFGDGAITDNISRLLQTECAKSRRWIGIYFPFLNPLG